MPVRTGSSILTNFLMLIPIIASMRLAMTALRCDGVNPGLLGMNKIISEDALCRALKAISETEGIAWLDDSLRHGTAPRLDAP
jgi:hypothetical protein